MSDTQNGFTPTNAYDVVGIFDANFNRLFTDARPLRASVKETAKLMKHPIESGATIVDFRVIDPIEIDLSLVLLSATYVDTYNQIRATFLGNDTINVQTNTGLYTNFLISGMPHEETPDHFDTITISLKLEEVKLATPTSSLPVTMTTQMGGNQTGNAASNTETNNANEKASESSARGSALYGGTP
jgi:hypothetical protein